MPDAADWYRESSPTRYHDRVFSASPAVRATLVRGRALKLQPLVAADQGILEYGAGICLNLAGLQCVRRVGYDVSGYGRDACTAAGVELVTDLAALAGQSFAQVLCHHALEHVPHPLESLTQIWDLLRPGGRLLLFVPFERGRHFLRHDPQDVHRHLYAWNPRTLGNLLDAAGFQIERISLGPYGYEQRLAPLARFGFGVYQFGLGLARLLKPVQEIRALARRPA